MKRLLLVLVISNFCMAMNRTREPMLLLPQQQVLILLVAGAAHPHADDVERALVKQKKRYEHKRQTSENYNNHHFTRMIFNKDNTRIHQPRSNSYVLRQKR